MHFWVQPCMHTTSYNQSIIHQLWIAKTTRAPHLQPRLAPPAPRLPVAMRDPGAGGPWEELAPSWPMMVEKTPWPALVTFGSEIMDTETVMDASNWKRYEEIAWCLGSQSVSVSDRIKAEFGSAMFHMCFSQLLSRQNMSPERVPPLMTPPNRLDPPTISMKSWPSHPHA